MAMALIDVVRKAAADNRTAQDLSTKCSIILDGRDLIHMLSRVQQPEEFDGLPLISRASGWRITNKVKDLIQEEIGVVNGLNTRLKNPNEGLTPERFLGLLNVFLRKLQQQVRVSEDTDSTSTLELLANLGPYLGRDIVNTITRCCVALTFWQPLEFLIPHGLISWNSCGDLIEKLAENKRGDLLCLCVKNMKDIRPSDLLIILRHFLGSPRDKTLAVVKQQWKSEAMLDLDTVSRMIRGPSKKKSFRRTDGDPDWDLKVTSLLHAMAVDGFSAAGICLHYVVSSSPDEVVLSSVISRLETPEVLKLLQYLGKWLSKYSVQHVTGPPASEVQLKMKLGKCVPSLDLILQWINLVLDEHHSSLVLFSEFHDELKSLRELVKHFADAVVESCSLASVVELVRSDARLPNIRGAATETGHLVEFLNID